MWLKFELRFAILLACCLGLLQACGGSSSSSDNAQAAANNPPPVVSQGYNGPGSKWDVVLTDDGSFSIERRQAPELPIDLAVSGNYATTSEGFLLLTVESASGEGAPQSGDTGWALEIPGFALFLKPNGNNDGGFIAMIDTGSCPEEDFIGNWVVVKIREGADATDPEQDFLGTFAYTAVTSEATLPSRYSLASEFAPLSGSVLRDGGCDDGLMRVDDADMYLSANGSALVHTSVDDPDESHIIFALPQTSITSIAAFDGAWTGMLFDQAPAENINAVMPAVLDCTAGVCDGRLLESAESSATAATFTLNLTGTLDHPEPGFIGGTLITAEGEGEIACVLSETQNLVSCVGQAPGNNAAMFNLVLKS